MTYCLNSINKSKNIKASYWLRLVIASGMVITINQQAFAVTKLDNTFTPYVGTSLSYDSNLLRSSGTPSTAKTFNKPIKDSFIYQIRAGLNVDWRYSLQQFIVKAEVNQNWYTAFSNLDYFGHDVLAQWNWVAGSRLKGEVGYKHDQSLASFAQLGADNLDAILNNRQTEQRYFANGEYQVLPSIYFKGGFLRNEWSYGGNRQVSNQIQNIGELSLQYRNLSRTMLGFRVDFTDGQYPNRPVPVITDPNSIDNAYFRTSYNFDWEWKYSDKLRVGGSAGYVQQDYAHLNRAPHNLNFSEPVARFNVNWLPSEKTVLVFAAWRDVYQAFTTNATFVLSQGVSLTPTWIATQKIRLEMPLAYQTQDYLGGATTNGASDLTRRSDSVVDVGLNLIYTPWINTELALNFKHESRSSNVNTSSYDYQSVGVNAKVEF